MSTVEDYQAATERVAADADRLTRAFATAALAGKLSQAGAVAKIAAAVNRANAMAVTLADAYVARAIEELSGVPTPTVGVLPVDDSERLVKAAETVMTDPTDRDMRLTRFARSEPFAAAQKATGQAMKGQTLVEGWVRQFDADPCQLCKWWWREGRVWPKDHPFQSHHHCNCQPRIVLVKNIKSTAFTRGLNRG